MGHTTRWVSRILVVAAFMYAMWYVYSNWIGRTPMRFGNMKIELNKGSTITMAQAMEQYANAPPGATGYPGTIAIHHEPHYAGQYIVDWTVKGHEYVFDWGTAIKAANANAKLLMKRVHH